MLPPDRTVEPTADEDRSGGDVTSTAATETAIGTTAPVGADPADERPRRRLGIPRRRPTAATPPTPEPPTEAVAPLEIAPNDPVIAYFQTAPGAVELASLNLESPALDAMRAAGVVLVVPLVTSGELVGLLQLGPRLSERGYSKDDRQLLDTLARYAAPALRLGQLVREQQAEAASRERIEQELRVAQIIQQQFLPKSLPDLPTWNVAAFYRPARTVGGDFYDFIELPDGRVMVVVGDVTDKGVPAALVMASTHALLRDTGPRIQGPSEVLARVNDLLCDDIPAHMFVTCLVMVLDPPTGEVVFANAGHNLPYVRAADGTVRELKATGMPLGLMPGLTYDERSAVIRPGEHLLLYSDGLSEQHDAHGEMFGFPRVAQVVSRAASGEELVDRCVSELAAFTGPDVEQEDDITLVALERHALAALGSREHRELLDAFTLPSVEGNERAALERVATALVPLGLTTDQTDRLKTAVAEAAMNAIEHGNALRAELPVEVAVAREGDQVVVSVTDHGGGGPGADSADTPDLELKLAGLQTTRGWGLFLIEHMVDAVEHEQDGDRHTVRLVMRLPDAADDAEGGPR
jgi:serine phosphatase RsbU (regulator of sigma subunit)/anti-sigma regulatory factor (Ser/Thr protein kinase)